MKKITCIIFLILFSMGFWENLYAQSYDALWQHAAEARSNGQPRTEEEYLQKIRVKAVKSDNLVQQLASSIALMECHSDLDPDSFQTEVAAVEKQFGNRADATERAVVHAVLGNAYAEMSSSWFYRFDNGILNDMYVKKADHFSHLFDDMEALAEASAKKYKPLTVLNSDGSIFDHDMLAVLIDFVDKNGFMTGSEIRELRNKAAGIYAQKGNREAEAIMLMQTVDNDKEMHELLMRCLKLEVGMDIAEKYAEYNILDKEKVDASLHPYPEESSYSNYRSDLDDERLRFIRWAKANVKKSGAWANLDNQMKRILRSTLVLRSNGSVLANKEFSLTLEYNNLKNAQLEVRKYDGMVKTKSGRAYSQNGELVISKSVDLGYDAANVAREKANLPVRGEVEISLSLPAGHYVVIFKGVNEPVMEELNVTSMKVLTTAVDSKNCHLYAVDAITGRPLSGVNMIGRNQRDVESDLGVTNEQGILKIERKQYTYVRAKRSEEDITGWVHLDYFNSADNQSSDEHCECYTDRSIYRPGQTVKGNILVFNQNGDETEVGKPQKVVVEFINPSRKETLTAELKTNEFGTADFEFKLPDDAEVGTYQLVAELMESHSSRSFISHVKVEEYKRPTFEVTFDKKDAVEQTYALGDSITVKGKALLFNGVPVQGGKVTCEIKCATTEFWWWRQPSWRSMNTFETITDDQGFFSVPVTLDASLLKDASSYSSVYNFRVHATVTDQTGETHEGEWTIRVSKQEFALQISSGEFVDLNEGGKISINARNANGDDVDVKGKYTLKRGAVIAAEGEFKSNTELTLPSSLAFGKYSLYVSADDSKENHISSSESFWVLNTDIQPVDIHAIGTSEIAKAENRDGKKMSGESDFVYTLDDEFSEDEPAILYFSPQHDDVYIYYNVFAGDRLMDSCQAVVNNDLHAISIPYRKEYGDGIFVRMVYVKDGEVGKMDKTFTYVRPEKQLTLSWSTFRDKLQPGQKEEWVLNIKDSKGNNVSGAETMAVMYDAALDRIVHHSWDLHLLFSRSVPHTWTNSNTLSSFPTMSLNEVIKYSDDFKRKYDELIRGIHNQFLVDKRRVTRSLNSKSALTGAAPSVVFAEAAPAPMLSVARAKSTVSVNDVMMEDGATGDADVSDDSAFSNAAVRADFSETAFFMPHLVSDKKGDVHIAFRLPESLTEWKFMGLAHTNDMLYGMITDKAVARKQFMVRPNMPRFVRWGDKASIVASIINQSEKTVKGTVRMRLINPVTGKDELVLRQPFSVETGKTVNADFQFDVLESYEGMECEIIAVSGDTSDGEKNFLPVLSTKQDMVETVPFYLTNENQKTIDLSHLFNQNSSTASNRNLSVEYTETPAWMCIEALRSVKMPEYDDAISLAASLHANTRIVALIDSFPMLSEYEDQEMIRAYAAMSRDKLRGLQLSDGGWSWFKGMQSSQYITLSVCEQLAMLPNRSKAIDEMLMRGLQFLDDKQEEYYKLVKEDKREFTVSNFDLRYLYVSSMLPKREVSKTVEKVRSEYFSYLDKNINDLTIYGTANAACALRAFGKTKTANKYVESLRQFTVTKPGQGRFYATDAAYYSWMDYRIPTQTAAMRAIMAENANDPYLNDMQLWLITQKQVQKWDNPMNTIDVADLLLSISPAVTLAKNSAELKPTVTLDGKKLTNFRTATLNTEREELEGRKSNLAMQGNVVVDAPQSQANKGVKTLTVARNAESAAANGNSISWGFAQAQFREEIGNLHSYSTNELSVGRKLFVYRNDRWVEADANTQLAVGEKVRIRQIVTADRDMDFVRIKAQHPACFEPIKATSGYQWLGTRAGYVSMHDADMVVFFDTFTRGTTTIDLEFYVNRTGKYQIGVTTVECAYAKQFGGHTSGGKVEVK